MSALKESPYRLPAPMASQIYQAGESGMGYTVFTVLFNDGTDQAYLTGNAVDFIHYPYGKGLKDVDSVRPHVGQHSDCRIGPNYSWCLFSE